MSLTLGYQKDITKIVVAASDGRTEVVDGYEEGLNLARRWRANWVPRRAATPSPAPTTDGDPPPPRAPRSAEVALPSEPPPRPPVRQEPAVEASRRPGAAFRERPSALSRAVRRPPPAPAAPSSERTASLRFVSEPSDPSLPRVETPSELQLPTRTSWSQVSDVGSIDETRTLPPQARPLRAEPPARSTLARRLPDLSDAFPPEARPQRRSLSSQHDGPSQPPLPTRGGDPHPSFPPVYEMVAEPTGPRFHVSTLPPLRPLAPSGPSAPPRKTGERLPDDSTPPQPSGNSSRPLPPLVPERMPSGPYPILRHNAPPDDLPPQDHSLRRLRRRERLPR
ncbi:MAG: hypothetical protein RMK29_00785 [Myxococcales bacterium]|nr:hypothetical protein [Myxococcota bacterium]MDW8280213.1 hypothetical protein [Myxococcales bacterium]